MYINLYFSKVLVLYIQCFSIQKQGNLAISEYTSRKGDYTHLGTSTNEASEFHKHWPEQI